MFDQCHYWNGHDAVTVMHIPWLSNFSMWFLSFLHCCRMLLVSCSRACSHDWSRLSLLLSPVFSSPSESAWMKKNKVYQTALPNQIILLGTIKRKTPACDSHLHRHLLYWTGEDSVCESCPSSFVGGLSSVLHSPTSRTFDWLHNRSAETCTFLLHGCTGIFAQHFSDQLEGYFK